MAVVLNVMTLKMVVGVMIAHAKNVMNILYVIVVQERVIVLLLILNALLVEVIMKNDAHVSIATV